MSGVEGKKGFFFYIEMNSNFFKIFCDYQEVSVRYDVQHQAVWCYYNPAPRPCFSAKMLQELRQVQQSIIDYFNTLKAGSEFSIRYVVLHSQVPGIFNLGGDLALFSKLIKERNRPQLLNYAKQCVDICYLNAVNLHLPLTTISLVEGVALGGGFESALSSNVLIATEDAEMGFPEIRFNLFPGMGAYSLLARICGMSTAEKIITSGAIYSGRKLYEMGIVNHLAETGNGPESVKKFIRQHQRSGNAHRALQQVRQRYHPINYLELADITEIWVEAALRLEDKDLRLMDRLVKAQAKKITQQQKRSLLRTKQDRRFVVEGITFPMADWSGETIMFDRRNNQDRRLFH